MTLEMQHRWHTAPRGPGVTLQKGSPEPRRRTPKGRAAALESHRLTYLRGEGALPSCPGTALALLILLRGAGMPNKPHTDPDCAAVFGSAGTRSLQTAIIPLLCPDNTDKVSHSASSAQAPGGHSLLGMRGVPDQPKRMDEEI